MLLNCGVGEGSWESLGLQGDPTSHKGDQCWVFMGRTDAEAETPVLWPPHAKSWLIGKAPDAGRDWGQEEKGMTEDEMAGWHHRLNGHEFEWTPGIGDGQGGLACCDSWGHKESDTTERLNWTELNWKELMENQCRLLITFHKLIASLGRNSYSKLHVVSFVQSLYTDHLWFIRHIKLFVKKWINVYCAQPFYGMSFLKPETLFVSVSFVAVDQTWHKEGAQ